MILEDFFRIFFGRISKYKELIMLKLDGKYNNKI
jgi:hypothetical protein